MDQRHCLKKETKEKRKIKSANTKQTEKHRYTCVYKQKNLRKIQAF